MRPGIRWQGGALALSVALSACAVVFGFDELGDRGSNRPDATPPVDSDAEPLDGGAEAGPLGCIAHLPEPPPGDEPGITTHFFALSSVGLRAASADAGATGLDLDCDDTREAAKNVCRTGGGLLADQLLVDYPGGIDNMAVALFQGLKQQLGVDLTQRLPEFTRDGVLGGVFTVYSPPLEQAIATDFDDGSIGMFFQPARGLRGDGVCDFWRPDADAGGQPAQRPLSRTDLWCVDDVYLSTLLSERAWVRGGVLVGRFPAMIIPVSFDRVLSTVSYVRLDSTYVTARVSADPEGGGLRLKGTIAGRWKVPDLVQQFAAHLSPPDAGECVLDSRVRTFFDGEMCKGLDVHSGFDVSSDVDCDALSFAVDFEAYQVDSQGAGVVFPSRVDGCLDGGAAPDSSFYYDCPAR